MDKGLSSLRIGASKCPVLLTRVPAHVDAEVDPVFPA